jgi:predicted nucleotidyltransferase
MLNDDYKEMLQLLQEEGADFILVGAYALAAHGYPRATMDIDIWVRPAPANAPAVLRALSRFGAPLHGLSIEDLSHDDTIFQIGVAPRRIDIITGVSGLEFDSAWNHARNVEIEGLSIRIPSLDDLIKNKTASGRTKDIADAEVLKRLQA